MTRAVSLAVLLASAVAAAAGQPDPDPGPPAEPGPAPRAANPDGSLPPVPPPADPAETVRRIVEASGTITARLGGEDTGPATLRAQADALALIDTLLEQQRQKDQQKNDEKKDGEKKESDKKESGDPKDQEPGEPKDQGKGDPKPQDKQKGMGGDPDPAAKDPGKGKVAPKDRQPGMPPPKPDDGTGKGPPDTPKDDPGGAGGMPKADPKPEPGPEPKPQPEPKDGPPKDRDPLQASLRPRGGAKPELPPLPGGEKDPAGKEKDGKDPGPGGVAQGPKEPPKTPAGGAAPGADLKGPLVFRPAMPLEAGLFDRKAWGVLPAMQRRGAVEYDESQFMGRYRDLLRRYYGATAELPGPPDR